MTQARRRIFWLILVIICALVQMTCLDFITIQGVKPSLVILLVIYFGISDGDERAMFTGTVCGVFQDVIGNVVLGHHVLPSVLVGYLTGRMAQRLITDHPAVKAGMVFLGSMIHGAIFVLILYIQNPGEDTSFLFFANVVPQAFYTAMLTPVVFYLLDRVFRQPDTVQKLR